EHGLTSVGAKRGGRFLELAVELLEHRLHGAYHERQTDEDEGYGNAGRGVGALHPGGREPLPDPAVRRVKRGERDAGNRGRQREGKVDKGVEQAAPGKAVAN